MNGMQRVRMAVGGAALGGNVLGCALLSCMALLITADVLGRGCFGASIPGVFEVAEIVMGALVGCGLAYTGATHSHLEVEIVTDLMPRRAQCALGVLGNALGSVFCAASGWKTLDYALDAFANGECTPTTNIRTWPFIAALGLGFVLLALVFLIHVWENAAGMVRHDA